MSQKSQYPSTERYPRDQQNPYTMVLNDLIHDQTISPNCRWLLIYLLSYSDNEHCINIAQIYNHAKKFMGRNKIYAVINEAIEAGYIVKMYKKENNLKRCCYQFSEKVFS